MPVHLAGGITITGVFCSFWDVNILSSWEYILFTLFVSILPDADHTKSLIGKSIYPIAKFIQRRYGHRTITHGLLALSVGWVIVRSFGGNWSLIFFWAYFSHILLDMLTKQGVPFFYPFLHNPCVIPANPELRFRTGDLKTETLMFAFFMLSASFSYPLMETGFWMNYNQAFGTQKHLANQFKKSENLLESTYIYRVGSEEFNGKGYVIEANESKTVLLENGKFVTLDASMIIKEVVPRLTNLNIRFDKIIVNDVSIDSINSLLKDATLKSADIYSSKKVKFKSEEISKLKVDHPNFDIKFQEIAEAKRKTFSSNPRIASTRNRIAALKKKDALSKQIFRAKKAKIDDLKSQLSEANLSEKERLMTEINIQDKSIKEASDNSMKINELKSELSLMIQENAINKQLYDSENITEKLVFNGTITIINISNSSSKKVGIITEDYEKNEIGNSDVINLPTYRLSYNEKKNIANWVSWNINSRSFGRAERQNDFREYDRLPKSYYKVSPEDYSKSGFDRGHNCPSADRTRTEQANSSTFYMINMIPQSPTHNRSLWRLLEEYSRNQVRNGKSVHIIMGNYGIGGIGSKGYKEKIGNGITVPASIWKVLVVLEQGQSINEITINNKIVAVDIPNNEKLLKNKEWKDFITTIDEIELNSNIDLLSNINDEIEKIIESKPYKL